MGIRAWQLYSWPKFDWKVPDESNTWPDFVHVQTTVSRDFNPSEADVHHGDTVWVAKVGSMTIGVGWEWTELRTGVVMLRDPNNIVTNVRFLDSDFGVEGELNGIVSANRVTHTLPWQETVATVLAATRANESSPKAEVAKIRPHRTTAHIRRSATSRQAAAA